MKSEKFVLGIFLVLSIFLLSSVIVSAQNATTQCDNDDICELGESSTCGDCNFASGWSCNHNDVCESGEPNRECDDCNFASGWSCNHNDVCEAWENNGNCPEDCKIEKTKEQIKCIFENSNEMQKCYTDDGQFGCSGTGTCVADVSGEKGKKLTWKSSCGGYGYTIIDGDNEYAEFKCATESSKPYCGAIGTKSEGWYHFNNELIRWDDCVKCQAICDAIGTKSEGWYSSCDKKLIKYDDCSPDIEPVLVKEQVKCVFKNSEKEQKCYTAEDNSRFSCSGTETCVMDVNGKKGEKLTWKSTCGGYAYTVTDGDNDYAEFNCLPEGNTTTEIIGGRGFRYSYWQCYSGEEEKQGSESSCKSSETWQSYAKEFCQDECYKDGSKCGVNSFSVAEECYLDFEKSEVSFIPSVEKEEKIQEEKLTEEKEEILVCKDSCPLDGKCYPFGYRKADNFCSDTGSFVEQLKGENSCDNNFECSSNVCVSGTCVSEGFLQKVMSWFKNLFG